EGETGADVLALGPHPGPAEGLAQSLQCVHGAGSEGERVALEVRDGHGVLCSLDMCWITPCGMQYITYWSGLQWDRHRVPIVGTTLRGEGAKHADSGRSPGPPPHPASRCCLSPGPRCRRPRAAGTRRAAAGP